MPPLREPRLRVSRAGRASNEQIFTFRRLPEVAAGVLRATPGAGVWPPHRLPGDPTRAAEFADICVPAECRDMIRAGALVAINTSGGKDSQAMTILLSRIVPRDRLVAVHAPLGEVEWLGTVRHVEATLPAGVPLILAPASSGKSLLDRVEERGKFPGIRQRYCTGNFKRTPIERELRRYLKAHPPLRWTAGELPRHLAGRKRRAQS